MMSLHMLYPGNYCLLDPARTFQDVPALICRGRVQSLLTIRLSKWFLIKPPLYLSKGVRVGQVIGNQVVTKNNIFRETSLGISITYIH